MFYVPTRIRPHLELQMHLVVFAQKRLGQELENSNCRFRYTGVILMFCSKNGTESPLTFKGDQCRYVHKRSITGQSYLDPGISGLAWNTRSQPVLINGGKRWREDRPGTCRKVLYRDWTLVEERCGNELDLGARKIARVRRLTAPR
jgi:hypothetical protein